LKSEDFPLESNGHEKLNKSTVTKNTEDFPLESNESSERTALTEKGAEHELHLLLRAALNRGHQLTQAEHLLLRAQRLLDQIIIFAMQKADHITYCIEAVFQCSNGSLINWPPGSGSVKSIRILTILSKIQKNVEKNLIFNTF
jgi:hypothetical protein